MRLILVEGPSTPAVSLDDMKRFLRVDFDDDNAKIEQHTASATEEVDGVAGIGRALVDQTWDLYLEEFCSGPIEIPLPPLIEVESVKYYDDDDAQQTLATSYYEVIGAGGHSPAHVQLKHGQSWPSVYDRKEPVVVRFRAGYVDLSGSPTGDIPRKIIEAIVIKTQMMYDPPKDNPDAMAKERAFENLLRYFRVYSA